MCRTRAKHTYVAYAEISWKMKQNLMHFTMDVQGQLQ